MKPEVPVWWLEAAREDAPSPFVANVFARGGAVVDDLEQVRYSALSPGQVRATVTGLYQLAARVQAQALTSILRDLAA